MNGTSREHPERASYAYYSPGTVPPEVREEIAARFPGAEIGGVAKKTSKDGTVEYEVELREGRQERIVLLPARRTGG